MTIYLIAIGLFRLPLSNHLQALCGLLFPLSAAFAAASIEPGPWLAGRAW